MGKEWSAISVDFFIIATHPYPSLHSAHINESANMSCASVYRLFSKRKGLSKIEYPSLKTSNQRLTSLWAG